MKKKTQSVPINRLTEEMALGIFIEKICFTAPESSPESGDSHRHDHHTFLLVESGALHVEIDFETYTLSANTLMYIHPSQIHRVIDMSQARFYNLSITADNIKEEYIRLLEESVLPSRPLDLLLDVALVLFESITLCQKLFTRKDDRMYDAFVKDCCNSFIGLCVSQYLELPKNIENATRYETITRAFRQLLEIKFTTMNKPKDYAQALNISPTYLRECIRIATGLSVCEQIHNRIILEAKRLLYYSDNSVKQIGISLGYEDYSYFSRLFKKIVGMTALEFKSKNKKPL